MMVYSIPPAEKCPYCGLGENTDPSVKVWFIEPYIEGICYPCLKIREPDVVDEICSLKEVEDSTPPFITKSKLDEEGILMDENKIDYVNPTIEQPVSLIRQKKRSNR